MEIVLPEIDQPPVEGAGPPPEQAFAPESAPGTPLPEDRATTEDVPSPAVVPVEIPPPAEPPAAPESEESKSARQKRWDKLTAEKYKAERERDQANEVARRALEALNGRQPAATSPAPAPETEQQLPAAPKKESFSSYEDYLEARADWKADVRVRQALSEVARAGQAQAVRANQTQQAAAAASAVQGMQQGIHAELQKGAEMFPDFMEVVSSSTDDIPLNVQAVMSRSGNVPGVGYYLAKHPEIVPKLAALPLDQLGVQVSRIATAMKPSAPSVTQAPPPGKPAGTRGRAVTMAYRDDFSPEQHIEWERANGLRK